MCVKRVLYTSLGDQGLAGVFRIISGESSPDSANDWFKWTESVSRGSEDFVCDYEQTSIPSVSPIHEDI